jgi:hypothetical protein
MRRTLTATRLATLALSALLVGVVAAAPVASAAPPPASKGAYGAATSHLTTSGTRGKVNVRELARNPSLTPRSTTTLTLPRPGRASTGDPRAASPNAGLGIAPDPIQATTTSNPPAGRPGFAGLSTLSGPATGFEPPDPYLAVGPDHVVQTTNVSLRVTDRRGGLKTSVSLLDFFQLPIGYEDTDPRVMYDRLHGRWIVTDVSWICEAADGQPYGLFDLAVSDTANPLGDFTTWYWVFQGYLPDFAAPGSSTDKLGFGANMFSMPVGYSSGCMGQPGVEFAGPQMIVVDWADLLAGGGADGIVDGEDFPGDPTFSTPRITVQAPATSPTMHVIAERTLDNGLTYRPYYLTITGSAVAHTLTIPTEFDLLESGVAGAWVAPPPPRQPTPDPVTTHIDSRPTDAIWQNGRLTFVSNHGCTPSLDTVIRACVRVTEINTTGVDNLTPPTLTQDFLIAENGRDSYFGGIGFALDGTLHAAWTRSSPAAGDYPSSVTAYQLRTDANNAISPTETLAPGAAVYNGVRWGDYVGVAQDPQVPNAVWQGNQYAAADGMWATYVSQLQTGGSSYVPIEPVRVLDTRFGIGLSGVFAANTPRTFQVAGAFGIPAGAIAVTGNVTIANQSGGGYLSVTPTAVANPTSSTINFPLGDTRANNLTVPLAPNGKLAAVYKAPGGKTTHLIVDISGYFLAGDEDATYLPITPVRVLDSRFGKGLSGPFSPNAPRSLSVAGSNGIPIDATAITGNLTVVAQTRAGYLSITPDPDPTPATSTLNFPRGDTRANGVSLPLNAAGELSIVYKASGGTTHVLLDVTGYYVDDGSGFLFYPLTPGRVLDTRPGVVLSGLTGSFGANIPRRLDVAGHWGAPAGALAVTGNLTVVNQNAPGYVSATLNAEVNPTTSVLNFPLGDTRANGVTLPLNASGRSYFVFKASPGKSTHLILDLSGYFQ